MAVLQKLAAFITAVPARFFHLSSVRRLNPNEVKEIKIPVPWGHIAGKWWGNPNVQPILAVHGAQHNAASFDRLAPLLNTEALLALDIPGHGWSSPFPVGIPYNFMHGVGILREIVKSFLKFEKPILLGHSLGSSLCFTYSSIFPEEVDTYISIDCARHMVAYRTENFLLNLKETIDKSFKYELNNNIPEYSYRELLEKFYQSHLESVPMEQCEVLLTRGVIELPNGKVQLCRDARIKLSGFDVISLENLVELAPKIKCKVLSIQATNGIVKNDFRGDVYRKTVDLISQNAIKSEHVILEGGHHLHLVNPDRVAQKINTFFK